MDLIIQPNGQLRLGGFLASHLADRAWTEFRAGVAFVKYSGVRHIASALAEFSKRGRVQICIGVDFGGSTAEGLKALMDCAGNQGEVWVYHNEGGSTFHPKLYFFKANDGRVDVAVGSGNLTEGGIYTNYEAAMLLNLSPSSPDQEGLIGKIESTLDSWCNPTSGNAKRVNIELIGKLLEQGYIVTERQAVRARAAKASPSDGGRANAGSRKAIFSTSHVSKAPSAPKWPQPQPFMEPAGAVVHATVQPPQATGVTGFLMTLQQTDAGVGQVTAGTSRRSPEIFVPLAARDYAPGFWGWPGLFIADHPKKKMDRTGVKIWLGTKIIEVNMMVWLVKHDLRLRCEALRSAGKVGDILRLERTDSSIGFDYLAYVVPQGTIEHRHYLAFCVHKAKGKSKKLWGYY
jgi:HKD family nuclease